MPPPIIISFTLSNKFSISCILSATLAPPKMAKNGLKQKYTYLEFHHHYKVHNVTRDRTSTFITNHYQVTATAVQHHVMQANSSSSTRFQASTMV
jgi:hypothetical protein